MWDWLRRHSGALQGLGALVTALAALAALVIIPLQIRAAEQIQMRQTTRDMYRGFVLLGIERPNLASAEFCDQKTTTDITAYVSYMEFMLYTGEQMMATSPAEWEGTLAELLAMHQDYFCASDDWFGYSTAVQGLISDLRQTCPAQPACQM